jgi:hypothetical protein
VPEVKGSLPSDRIASLQLHPHYYTLQMLKKQNNNHLKFFYHFFFNLVFIELRVDSPRRKILLTNKTSSNT